MMNEDDKEYEQFIIYSFDIQESIATEELKDELKEAAVEHIERGFSIVQDIRIFDLYALESKEHRKVTKGYDLYPINTCNIDHMKIYLTPTRYKELKNRYEKEVVLLYLEWCKKFYKIVLIDTSYTLISKEHKDSLIGKEHKNSLVHKYLYKIEHELNDKTYRKNRNLLLLGQIQDYDKYIKDMMDVMRMKIHFMTTLLIEYHHNKQRQDLN